MYGYCHDEEKYFCRKNLQGDVIAIYDTAGVVQAKYKYDAFGNCSITNSTNTHLANYNPIRYRGYYWDSETNWYFLNARYYSPEWRRFISPDDTAYLDPKNVNGLNLYVYCNNNPIMYVDPNGDDAILFTVYCNGGILIVGHTVLAIQDENGNWYITEYTGSQKDDAKVKYMEVNGDIVKYMSDHYGVYSENDIENYKGWKKLKAIIANFIHGSSPYSMVYLKGDYSGSLQQASESKNSDLGGYNLIINNCGQYIHRILRNSYNDIGKMHYYFKYSITLIPAIFHLQTQWAADLFE